MGIIMIAQQLRYIKIVYHAIKQWSRCTCNMCRRGIVYYILRSRYYIYRENVRIEFFRPSDKLPIVRETRYYYLSVRHYITMLHKA